MDFLRKSRPLLSSLLKSKQAISLSNSNPTPKSLTRSFYTQRRQQAELQHFPRRGRAGGYHHWYRNPRVVVTATVVSGAAAVTVYFGNLETVPYTKRTHFVLLSPSFERQLGESQFEEIKAKLRSKILPSIHPDSIRVRLIAKDIIGALQRGLQHGERRWSDLEYSHSPDEAAAFDSAGSEQVVMAVVKRGEIEGRGWTGEDEVLDDQWVRESRKEKSGVQAATKHLEGLNWEVVVVRDKMVNAFCLPGGKIVVFTGLLDHFRSDDEIATVIGHEVV